MGQPITQTYAEELFARLLESGAINYLQDTIEVSVDGGPELDVIIILQHKGRPSPHELRLEAEAKVEQLEALLKTTSPQKASCTCLGKCEQWYLASDEVDETCKAVHMKVLKGREVREDSMSLIFQSPYGLGIVDTTKECIGRP